MLQMAASSSATKKTAVCQQAQKTWVATPISTVALLKEGTYLALLMAELQGQTVLLDQKSFVITESATTVDPGTIGLAGSVAIAAPSVKAGEAQSRDDRVRNTGSTNISQLKVQRVVLNLATNAEVQRLEDTVDLAIGAQKSWLGTPISTAALAKGNYQVLLLAQVQGQLLQLDQKTFVVTEAGTPVVPGNTAKPIPSFGHSRSCWPWRWPWPPAVRAWLASGHGIQANKTPQAR